MHNVLHNLIHKIDLPAVQIYIGQISGKCFFCGIHIQPDDFADELAQRLLSVLGFVILLCSDFAPENFL